VLLRRAGGTGSGQRETVIICGSSFRSAPAGAGVGLSGESVTGRARGQLIYRGDSLRQHSTSRASTGSDTKGYGLMAETVLLVMDVQRGIVERFADDPAYLDRLAARRRRPERPASPSST